MFSSRLPRLESNAFSHALRRARRNGRPLHDLTETNPTAVGLSYSPSLVEPLAFPAALDYHPEPRGLAAARAAVAREFARGGVTARPDHIVLTSGTSEAYGLLFKLLCDPGDEVLIPSPSYPLFELLSGLDAVAVRHYVLDPLGGWVLDRGSLERAVTPSTRAVLVVSPNNPTGSVVSAGDRDWLAAFCADRGLAIVADEVFADYLHAPATASASFVSFAAESRALTFTLGGLSKSAGLPQLKLAWMLVSGPPDLVDGALERLDVICDTYLSVSTPVQVAAASLIGQGRVVRDQIRGRLAQNLGAIETGLASHPEVALHRPAGGWSAVLRVPAVEPEEALVVRLLDDGVVVHPGYFFDFAHEAYLVVSLLPEPDVFRDGLARILATLDRGPA